LVDGEEDQPDYSRAWERASELAQEIGVALAVDSSVRQLFLPELIADDRAQRPFECGRGLAEGADNLAAMWDELVAAYRRAGANNRNATLLGGFAYEAHKINEAFCEEVLELAVNDPDLAPTLPYLQARVAIDEGGIARLRRALAGGSAPADRFAYIANGVVRDAPPIPLSELLVDLAKQPTGVEVAIDILHMRLYCDRQDRREIDPVLIHCGRDLLQRVDLPLRSMLRHSAMATVIKVCLAGSPAEKVARTVCRRLREALETYRVFAHDVNDVLVALLKAQPFVALDELLIPGPPEINRRLFEPDEAGNAIEQVDATMLEAWADRGPAERYPLIGHCLSILQRKPTGEDANLSPIFMRLLDKAPDKIAFLGDFADRIHPRGWSGSLGNVLVRRKELLSSLGTHPDVNVRQWFTEMLVELDRWIDREHERERGQEESFE
jgi:hypothetical protein